MKKNRLHKLRKRIIEGNHMQSVKLEEADEHVCLNCRTKFRGDYCPVCKQKATTTRLTVSDILKNGVVRFTKIDSGFLHTVIDLLYRPGYMVRDYIRGRRIEYVEPLMLLVILLAVGFFIPTAFPDDAVKPFPEEWSTKLASYPISLNIAKALHWMWCDEQRYLLLFSSLFGVALSHSLKIVRAGKEHVLNISESIHLILYNICYGEIIGIFIDLILLAVPKEYLQSDEPYMYIWLIIIVITLTIMIRDCTQIGRRKLVICMLIFPLLSLIYILIFLGILRGISVLELPWELAKEINILSVGLGG